MLNTNPIRLIATCGVYLTDGDEINASTGIDVNYDATAHEIHNEILRVVTECMSEDGHEIETTFVKNVCNLGQVPMPVQKAFTRPYTFGDQSGCLVCGGDHNSAGLPCPKMSPHS